MVGVVGSGFAGEEVQNGVLMSPLSPSFNEKQLAIDSESPRPACTQAQMPVLHALCLQCAHHIQTFALRGVQLAQPGKQPHSDKQDSCIPCPGFAAAENKAMDDVLLSAIHDIARTGNVW